MKYFGNLRGKLTLYVSLAATIPLLLLGVVSFFLIYVSHKEYTHRLSSEIAARVISEINLVTDDLNKTLVAMQQQHNFAGIPPRGMREILELYRRMELGGMRDVVEELAFLNRQGTERAKSSRTSPVREGDLLDRSLAPEFREPMKRQALYVGPVITPREPGEPHIFFSVPVVDLASGKTTGVVSAKVRISRMWNFAMHGAVGGDGSICVVNGEGLVIAHADPSVVARHVFIDYRGVGDIRQEVGGRRVIRTVSPFELGGRTFHVAVDIPLTTAMAMFKSLLIVSTLLLVLFLVVGVICGMAAVRSVVLPIESLAKAAREISGGNFALRAEKGNRDEIGDLADSFNAMADRLISKIQSLDEKEKTNRRNYAYQRVINQILQSAMQGISNAGFFQELLETVSSAGERDLHNSGAIFLAQEESRELRLAARFDFSDTCLPRCGVVRYGECLCGRAALSGEPVFASDMDEKHERCCEQMGSHGHYCIPFFSSEKRLLGVITFVLREGGNYDPHTFGFLQAVAKVTALVFEKKAMEDARLKLESRLRQAHRVEAIGTLAGGIAHDFNNILSPILGFTYLVMNDMPSDCADYHRLEQVYSAGLKARDLASQILAFSRQMEIKSVPIKPDLICLDALKFLRAAIPASIEIHHHIAPSGMTKMDPTHLHQVLMNLCTNSYHAMEETGGRIDVSLRRVGLSAKEVEGELDAAPGEYVALTVSDTGMGISREIADRIFDPYFTTKEAGKGTGMGLSIVHGIVRSYGGIIRMESRLGQGTAFTVYLPVMDECRTEIMHRVDPQAYRGGEHILLVDDEKEVAEQGQATLQTLGYRVTVRNSGKEALELFRAELDTFDLVVTDMTMFGMSGAVLAQELMALRPAIPVILCTGYSAIMTREKARALGIRALLYKPVLVGELAKFIREALDEEQGSEEDGIGRVAASTGGGGEGSV